MEASRQWLFSATLLATATILVSFLFGGSLPGRLFSSHTRSTPTLRHMQWNLPPVSTAEQTDAPIARPVERQFPIVSGFGFRRHPILQIQRLHAGVDFAAPKGTPVLATASGIVERISPLSDSSTFGVHVVILHDSSSVFSGRYRTLYAHLSGVSVKRGQRVTLGEPIGMVGSTGRSTAAHLHYEIHLDDQPVDPMDYLGQGDPGMEVNFVTRDSLVFEEFLIR